MKGWPTMLLGWNSQQPAESNTKCLDVEMDMLVSLVARLCGLTLRSCRCYCKKGEAAWIKMISLAFLDARFSCLINLAKSKNTRSMLGL